MRRVFNRAAQPICIGAFVTLSIAVVVLPAHADSALASAFEQAWQRQPAAVSLAERQRAVDAGRRAAAALTAAPPSLELGTRSNRFNRNQGARELDAGLAVPLWLPGQQGPSVTGLGSFQSEGIDGSDNFRGRQYAAGANFRNNGDELMYVARLKWNVLGNPGYSEGDIAYSQTPQLAVGGGYSYNPAINTSSSYDSADPAGSNFSLQSDLTDLTVSKRQLGATGNGRLLGNGVMNLSTWALDVNFKYRGWSLHSEFYYRNNTLREQVIRNIPRQLGNSTGWYIQSGYYLIPKRLEIAARYSYWDPDTKASADLIKQIDAAVTYYFHSTQDHKITFQYSAVTMGTPYTAHARTSIF